MIVVAAAAALAPVLAVAAAEVVARDESVHQRSLLLALAELARFFAAAFVM